MKVNRKIILEVNSQGYWKEYRLIELPEKVLHEHKSQCPFFYEAEGEWIRIFDSIGGSGTGYFKGELLKKIFIGDSEFERKEGGREG